MQCESCHASDKQPAIAHLQQFGPFRVPSTRPSIYAFPIGSLPPHPEDGCGGDSWGRCDKIKVFTMSYRHTVLFSSHSFKLSIDIPGEWVQARHFAVHFGAGPGVYSTNTDKLSRSGKWRPTLSDDIRIIFPPCAWICRTKIGGY